jgi:hypothetical protein
LQREPHDSGAAVARVGCCEGALAEASSSHEQNERARTVLVQHLQQSLPPKLVWCRGRDSRCAR